MKEGGGQARRRNRAGEVGREKVMRTRGNRAKRKRRIRRKRRRG